MSNNRILTELPRKGNANRLDYMKMICMTQKVTFIIEEMSVIKLKERCLKELNIDLNTGTISEVCSGKRKTHKGYIFKYID